MTQPDSLPADISQALRDAENALRDFIAAELSRLFGASWEDGSGVSPERLAKWKERKAVEAKRQASGVVDERLIYYADFYDLRTILKKHWSDVFSSAFGDWKKIDVYLEELEKLRDPDAHRRELLPHQKQLALGISGEIRTRIVRYRSKRATSDDVFPLIESARDSLGNMWIPGNLDTGQNVFAKMTLRVGDRVQFVLTARDPEEAPLEYGMQVGYSGVQPWQASDIFTIELEAENIGKLFTVSFFVRSNRAFHAHQWFDDRVHFHYSAVLPRN